MLRALTAASLLVLGTWGTSVHIAKLCQGQTCDSKKYPILDYDQTQSKCICRAHPCWDDDGQVHSCPNKESPHLIFSYTKEGKLQCGCAKEPHYETLHIAKDLCPGVGCDKPDVHPILDYDGEEQKCICRAHPCWDSEGLKHSCDKAEFPILRYREDKDESGDVKKVCECVAKLVLPRDDEL